MTNLRYLKMIIINDKCFSLFLDRYYLEQMYDESGLCGRGEHSGVLFIIFMVSEFPAKILVP